MNAIHWVWATPPSEELRELCRDLELGVLPQDVEVLKDGRGRTVWRLPEVAGGLVLKHYRVKLKDVFKASVLPWRAESEYRVMEDFCHVGLPTVRPVAYADRRSGRRMQEAWFISRLVPGAATVAEEFERLAGDRAACWDLARRAVLVAVELHRHPYFHRDLHVGNLLVDADGRLLIIDLHSVWRVPVLTKAMRWENLSRLLFSMRAHVSLEQAPRLIRDYAQERGEDPAALLRVLRRSLATFEADYVRGRSRRCMVNSSEFVRDRVAASRVHRRRSYDLTRLAQDVERHHEIVSRGGRALLGSARRSAVSLVQDEGGQRVVKHYSTRGLLDGWRARVGLGRARTAWKAARRCWIHGIPTPRALALRELTDGSAFLVTDAVVDAQSLEAYAESLADGGDQKTRAGIAFATGHLVGRLSRAGILHHDLSTKNLLIGRGTMPPTKDRRTEPPPDLPNILLIDLDNMRRREPYSKRSLIRMLKQVGDLPPWITRTDLQRFARGYAAAAGRALSRDVVARAAVLTARRQARRERRRAAARPNA